MGSELNTKETIVRIKVLGAGGNKTYSEIKT